MDVDAYHEVVVVDDRAGFYMVPAVAIVKARERLSGGHLSEALAGLVCLARESFLQNGASPDEQQCCEASLDTLCAHTLGVSRARALRIVDNLADADALTKEAHRFDGTRRLPMKLTFVDLALPFAYISGPAFRTLRANDQGTPPPLGSLALYLTLVALAGEQRDHFPGGNRRIARASQPELAKLSGLSVSSIKRTLAIVKDAGLLTERAQPANVLKTKAIYRLIDPPTEPPTRTASSPGTDSSQANQWPAHSHTDDSPQPDSPRVHSQTADGSQANAPTAQGPTDRPTTEPSRTHESLEQKTNVQINISPLGTKTTARQSGGEVELQELDHLVDVFSAWRSDAVGPRRHAAAYDAAAWRSAAAVLLKQYDLQRILAGIERLTRDPLLADKATTLPAFVAVADRAITRAAADRRYRDANTRIPATTQPGRSWASASELLRRAVSAYGSGGETAGLEYLHREDTMVADFAIHIGWRTLTHASEDMTDIKFAYLTYCNNPSAEAA